MSEEAAFLEALKANPADDTARLVYADWLDEHGEPAKAEYLRLVATLAQAEQDYAREQPEVARLLALAEQLSPEWRGDAGSRFKLILYACLNVAKKVALIKAIRSVRWMPLVEVRDIVELAPKSVFECVPFEQAFLGRDPIREADGAVYVHPCERDDIPVGIRYNLLGKRWVRFPYKPPATEDGELLTASIQTALEISAEQAAKLVGGEEVLLAERLELAVGQTRKTDFYEALGRCFTRPSGSYPEQGITLHLTAIRVLPEAE
ncbi:MAG: ribosomal protein L7/L12 [Planctomycetes bacterium]|nr:ribosomal protein L7/L12 [Planctomycetota bacterium]